LFVKSSPRPQQDVISALFLSLEWSPVLCFLKFYERSTRERPSADNQIDRELQLVNKAI
jgi:hypothetical protein